MMLVFISFLDNDLPSVNSFFTQLPGIGSVPAEIYIVRFK